MILLLSNWVSLLNSLHTTPLTIHILIVSKHVIDIDRQIIEEKLAAQLRNDDRLSSLVDVFYFEHHVMQAELGGWGGSATESVGYSLEMMSDLRRKGVASHYWV